MTKKVLNASGMKKANQKKILDMLRVESVSRAELSRKTGLTRAGISGIIEELMAKGVVVEGETMPNRVGRSSVELKLNGERYLIAGISISRDYCTVGISNFCCEVLEYQEVLFDKDQDNPHTVFRRITEIIREMMAGREAALLGIGIISPGALDIANGRILSPPNFEKWHNLNICSFFRSQFECPVVLENDAKAMAISEKYCGAAGTVKNYVEIVVDYGIGGGIVVDGQLYKGSSGSSSEFGHITVDMNGGLCSCGNRGCAELYANIPNIIAYARKYDSTVTSWEEIVDRAEAGDADMGRVIERETECLAAVIVSAVNIIDPEVVFIGGDISYKSRILISGIQKRVDERIMRKAIHGIEIRPSGLTKHKRLIPCFHLLLSYVIDHSILFEEAQAKLHL
ncbi:ROK family transcriptional regulator [Muricomes sp. OA1]|uniref:ROK family protein n=1 Tax=Hungatella hathewayi TaxID=154046 RepID=A0A3E2WV88_9FIRM|nr:MULTISPECIES: ROK family transcriptional regulator [Clostridia]MCH1972092.1 ROK family transcriptional regulator [Muricomes sp. OA1]MRM88179.1 ROK family protein [Faecalicatena contorta]RGC31330.1 ROK family protein [Hungatella hathewayi]GKH30897.1 transcriptional regulator [Faecalicatena contorta]